MEPHAHWSSIDMINPLARLEQHWVRPMGRKGFSENLTCLPRHTMAGPKPTHLSNRQEGGCRKSKFHGKKIKNKIGHKDITEIKLTALGYMNTLAIAGYDA